MDSDLKLKLQIQKNEVPIIELSHSQKRYKKILKHVMSLTDEEIKDVELMLDKLERRI